MVALEATLALLAATLGARHKLPLGGSIIYATAQQGNALVWTQDADFEGLVGSGTLRKVRRCRTKNLSEKLTDLNGNNLNDPGLDLSKTRGGARPLSLRSSYKQERAAKRHTIYRPANYYRVLSVC